MLVSLPSLERMLLERVTIRGFKSFFEPQTIIFSPGLTVISAPNGSGKSNILDALRFAFGARPQKMGVQQLTDLFFDNGSRRSDSISVTAIFVDPNESAERALLDVQLSRNQPGENRYRLNGRLRPLSEIKTYFSTRGVTIGLPLFDVSQGRVAALPDLPVTDLIDAVCQASGVSALRDAAQEARRKLTHWQKDLEEIRRNIQAVESQQQRSATRKAQAAMRLSLTEQAESIGQVLEFVPALETAIKLESLPELSTQPQGAIDIESALSDINAILFPIYGENITIDTANAARDSLMQRLAYTKQRENDIQKIEAENSEKEARRRDISSGIKACDRKKNELEAQLTRCLQKLEVFRATEAKLRAAVLCGERGTTEQRVTQLTAECRSLTDELSSLPEECTPQIDLEVSQRELTDLGSMLRGAQQRVRDATVDLRGSLLPGMDWNSINQLVIRGTIAGPLISLIEPEGVTIQALSAALGRASKHWLTDAPPTQAVDISRSLGGCSVLVSSIVSLTPRLERLSRDAELIAQQCGHCVPLWTLQHKRSPPLERILANVPWRTFLLRAVGLSLAVSGLTSAEEQKILSRFAPGTRLVRLDGTIVQSGLRSGGDRQSAERLLQCGTALQKYYGASQELSCLQERHDAVSSAVEQELSRRKTEQRRVVLTQKAMLLAEELRLQRLALAEIRDSTLPRASLARVKEEQTICQDEIDHLEIEIDRMAQKIDDLSGQLAEMDPVPLPEIQHSADEYTRALEAMESFLVVRDAYVQNQAVRSAEEARVLNQEETYSRLTTQLTEYSQQHPYLGPLLRALQFQRIPASIHSESAPIGAELATLIALIQTSFPSIVHSIPNDFKTDLRRLNARYQQIQQQLSALPERVIERDDKTEILSSLLQRQVALRSNVTALAQDASSQIEHAESSRIMSLNRFSSEVSQTLQALNMPFTAHLTDSGLDIDGRQLSGGQRSVLGLAMAFAMASLHESGEFQFILDEADAALDDAARQKVATWIRERTRGGQIIIVSHHPLWAEYADSIVSLMKGPEGWTVVNGARGRRIRLL